METNASEARKSASDSTSLAGGGEMGALMRAHDWITTPAGSISSWPQSLHTAISICLSSRFPIIIFWGSELVQFYNDAYRPMLGMSKHPSALGQKASECWPEIWDVIGPMLKGVLETGEATWSNDQLLLIDRNGYVEECYFTFSYSPIRNEVGTVDGVFCAVTENTGEVLATRRLRTLSQVAARAAEATTAQIICAQVISVLATNPNDVPFAFLYLLDSDNSTARLSESTSPQLPASLAPETLSLDDTASKWPLYALVQSGQPLQEVDLEEHIPFALHSQGFIIQKALVISLLRSGQNIPYGFLVAGVNPCSELDDLYKQFFSLLAGQIATALANVNAYREAQERAEALAELDQAKTTFFSNVSHEFRTPLTLLLGPLEIVLADAHHSLSPEQREVLEVVRRNGLRLLKLVNTLLDFSRLQVGRMEAIYTPTNLALLTADLSGVFRSAIERAGLRLIVDCQPLDEPVYVDHDMWEKIVLNLLSNALKFTFEGEIRVTLHTEGEHIALRVQDSGTGIAPTDMPHLFERFYRVRGVQARTHEGSGIGLSLVQELVQMHQGVVQVDSVIGEGTTVTVRIPRGKVHLPAERIGTKPTLATTAFGAAPFVEEALHWLPSGSMAPAPFSLSPENPSSILPDSEISHTSERNLKKSSVLVVDDNADMRDYLYRLLISTYVVETVSDGRKALALLQSRIAQDQLPPDLIILDIMLPGMDGLEVLQRVKADARFLLTPVILLSARAGEEATIEGLEKGADDYLVKPFSARELLAIVRSRLEIASIRKHALQQEREQTARMEQLAEENARLYQQAQEALQERDLLLAMISHDLKNPLAAVKGYVQLLQRSLSRLSVASAVSKEQENIGLLARRIEIATNRITAQINELLDLVQLDAGSTIELKEQMIDFVSLVQGTISEYQAPNQPQRIKFNTDLTTLVGYGDPLRLGRIVANLLTNALKYDPEEKPVEVTLSREEISGQIGLVLSVCDQGIGIPEADQLHIFSPFHRGSNVETMRGTGIGLASAQFIAELYGGLITVTSKLGIGSTFTLYLPLRTEKLQQDQSDEK